MFVLVNIRSGGSCAGISPYVEKGLSKPRRN